MKTFSKIVKSSPDTFKANMFIIVRARLERVIEIDYELNRNN